MCSRLSIMEAGEDQKVANDANERCSDIYKRDVAHLYTVHTYSTFYVQFQIAYLLYIHFLSSTSVYIYKYG